MDSDDYCVCVCGLIASAYHMNFEPRNQSELLSISVSDAQYGVVFLFLLPLLLVALSDSFIYRLVRYVEQFLFLAVEFFRDV